MEEKVMAMKDKKEPNSQRVKNTYQKPEIRKIQLKPGEAVLGGCKTASYAGPGSPTNCTVLSCFSYFS